MFRKPVSRREMIKILAAAAGGLSAAAFLPARWLKPVVSAGVIPTHARASVCANTIDSYVMVAGGQGNSKHYTITSLTLPSPILQNQGAAAHVHVLGTDTITVLNGTGTFNGTLGSLNVVSFDAGHQIDYSGTSGGFTFTVSIEGVGGCWTGTFFPN